MKRKLLRIGIVSLMTVLLLPSLGCAKMVKKLKKKVSNPFVRSNYPYEPDTPAPAPHEGTFVSDNGTMTFNGDGESVIIDFDEVLAEAVWLPAGRQEASYQFLSGDIPPHRKIPIRYDVAMYISITVDDSSSVLAVGLVGENGSKSTGTGCTTADRITFIDVELDGRPGVNFVKTADAAPRLSPATVKEDGGKKGASGMSEARQREIASSLSTKENAKESEFGWFTRTVYSRTGADAPDGTTRIDNMPLLLNGGWKCFMCGEGSSYTGTDARVLNAELKTDGKSVILKLNWWRVLNPWVEGIEDESDMPPTVCNGTWDGKRSSVHFVSDMGNVDLSDFYISADGDAEYAVGTFSWSSGEQDYFAMMRGKTTAGNSKPVKAGKPSTDEVLLLRAKKRSGAPEAELEWNPDGTATIHLFETVDDGDGDSHVSTWDWYTIDPATMTGTDFMEMPVDLN